MPGMREESIGGSTEPAKWVNVRDREDAGRIVGPATNVGGADAVRVWTLLFESTGEVRTYLTSAVTRCEAPVE